MKRVIITESKPRKKLANPFSSTSLHERLIKENAIDLRENYYIEDTKNGYIRIHPVDPNKRFS